MLAPGPGQLAVSRTVSIAKYKARDQLPIAVLALVKAVLMLPPNNVTAPMIATATNVTSRPYSTALAPDSSVPFFYLLFGYWFLWLWVAPVNKLLNFCLCYSC
jgi:hypothetical protein